MRGDTCLQVLAITVPIGVGIVGTMAYWQREDRGVVSLVAQEQAAIRTDVAHIRKAIDKEILPKAVTEFAVIRRDNEERDKEIKEMQRTISLLAGNQTAIIGNQKDQMDIIRAIMENKPLRSR